MTTSQTTVHVQYRNATYYGQLSNNHKRNGKGMLILDTSTVLFADWKDNQIDGMFVYLADGIRAYGTMLNGRLDGYNILSTTLPYTSTNQPTQYSSQQASIRTFYGTFRNEKLYGRCVMIDSEQLIQCQCSNNQIQEITAHKLIRQRQVYEILKQTFPSHLYTLDEFLTKFVKTFIAQLEQLDEISRYQPCINYFSQQSDEKFFGFQEISKPNKKFGILLRENELISVGEHNNDLLQGIGRLYDKDHLIDGAFRNGRVEGIGIDYNRLNNKFVLEIHDGVDDRVEEGFGFPLRQILQFRKEFHLRSVFFFNDIAILGLKNKLQGLVGQIFTNTKRSAMQSRQRDDYRQQQRDNRYTQGKQISKRIPKSPLRERLSKYEMQSDFIEDNSPLKNRPNQYRPVDKNSNYFREENYQHRNNQYMGQQARYSRTGYNDAEKAPRNSRRFNQTNVSNSNRSQERNERFSQDRSKKKFQERQSRQQETYNQILRQNAPYVDQSRVSRAQSNYNPQQQRERGRDVSNNRGRKDTRDLVKELQNQEKERRLTLDEIYSRSNLYGRNKK